MGTGIDLNQFLCPEQGKKGGWSKGVREVLWNLPKEKYVCISMKGIWCNLDGPSKNKELWSYVVKFEFSRPKVAQIGRSKC